MGLEGARAKSPGAVPSAFTFQLAVHPTNQDTVLEAPVAFSAARTCSTKAL